ncbi:MAG: tRNA preQ1(34) S-adenosylmethionine ribosyltransferase-isomerase QueA [Verrucomicrobiales bacterium]|nr:tRNA preQ1(34) S-adenosylmethionine ribosyltransferase-isomerase QueA [Verrucomicrobiales bacterium]
MRTADFDYELPVELIAQSPAPERDRSRLMVLERATGRITHGCFADLRQYLRSGDLLLLNNSRVLHARLRGTKAGTGGMIELLLLKENDLNDWWVMLRPGKRVRRGTMLTFHDRRGHGSGIDGTILEKNAEGHCRILFSGATNLRHELDRIGETPLPPYIIRQPRETNDADRERYQTVYAQVNGSIAAPTAGLHFTESLLDQIREQGVQIQALTLHVGAATFAPVKTDEVAAHRMHEEYFSLGQSAAEAITAARAGSGRVFAVGTTTVRVLESVAAAHHGNVICAEGRTRLFICPPYKFRVADALLTNFHLPRSTLLMLVSAFAAPGETRGRDLILAAYAEAIRERYRFFSYGDAMLIL